MPNPHRSGSADTRPRDAASMQLTDEEVQKILSGDGRTIAEKAADLAKQLQELRSAQIRNFYGPITKIRESHESAGSKINRLHLMRPRLVYMAARERNALPLQHCFEKLIKAADEKKLNGLFDFAEAVVGYHKQYQR